MMPAGPACAVTFRPHACAVWIRGHLLAGQLRRVECFMLAGDSTGNHHLDQVRAGADLPPHPAPEIVCAIAFQGVGA
jgi:hypothetical protein